MRIAFEEFMKSQGYDVKNSPWDEKAHDYTTSYWQLAWKVWQGAHNKLMDTMLKNPMKSSLQSNNGRNRHEAGIRSV